MPLTARTRLMAGPSKAAQKTARARRARAQAKFKPEKVKLLLVAEAPPGSPERYFYFASVTEHDSLFRYVVQGILKAAPTRSNKAELLGRLQDRGVYLVDLITDPIGAAQHEDHVPGLVRRAKKLQPEKIILIKAPVYDAAFRPLREASLPVIDERVPFPGSGQQRKFEEAFARALSKRPPGHRRKKS